MLTRSVCLLGAPYLEMSFILFKQLLQSERHKIVPLSWLWGCQLTLDLFPHGSRISPSYFSKKTSKFRTGSVFPGCIKVLLITFLPHSAAYWLLIKLSSEECLTYFLSLGRILFFYRNIMTAFRFTMIFSTFWSCMSDSSDIYYLSPLLNLNLNIKLRGSSNFCIKLASSSIFSDTT